MSRMPMGKVLLRNVIRHTDAHNKIQEESEMWKLRDMEKQAQEHSIHGRTYDAHLARGSMHCDRVLEEGPVSARDRLGHVSEREEREARYWTRKLYEFEANDPDRWGHSGFKELYPEEFQTDGEKECSDDENVQHQKRKGKASLESSDKHKHSKKSSRKKKKKKKKRKRAGGSEVDGSSSEEEGHKPKRRKRSSGKAKHRRKKREKQRERKDNGSTADSDSEEGKEKQICIPRKRAKEATGSPEPVGQPQRKRRNWKVTNEEKSEDSSED
ncbi:uncharacterized protein NKAPD1 [Scleropages formosus]|nr:uncharacterized protein NKAPD1 [Scleropages formosus]XP_018598269.1 uncharacterized protein NKAPD1 [Scleropages formosus]XP_018598270.1 uncharacterized protein NKAPD1 [Scleropages formosus]